MCDVWEFQNEILLKGEECKTRQNFNFLKNSKNNKIAKMVQGSLENSLDLK